MAGWEEKVLSLFRPATGVMYSSIVPIKQLLKTGELLARAVFFVAKRGASGVDSFIAELRAAQIIKQGKLSADELLEVKKTFNNAKLLSKDEKMIAEIEKAINEKEFGKVKELLEVLENDNYEKYVARKLKQKGTVKSRQEWEEARNYWLFDSPMARGNAFNRKAKDSKWYTYNEVTLANGKRVDGYTPPRGGKSGKIVSRKATDLEDIEFSTFERYLKEMKDKYSAGERINAPIYGDKLKGKVLEGDLILEIPSSNRNFSRIKEYEDFAEKYYSIKISFQPE